MISVLGAEKLSLDEIEAFLAASESVRFVGTGRAEVYGWVERLLCQLSRAEQMLPLIYLFGRNKRHLLNRFIDV